MENLMRGLCRVSDLPYYVVRGAIGVYILSRNGRSPDYVGRSDCDLADRIRRSASEGRYMHFWFQYESSPTNGYKSEGGLWHLLEANDNLNHPGVPAAMNWRCPEP